MHHERTWRAGAAGLLLLLLALAAAPAAQAQILPLRVHSIEEGLAQSVVQAMLQDSRGFMWFGTQDGLSRFDGMEFENFGPAQGLEFTTVRALFEDKDQALWIGVEGGGAYVLRHGRAQAVDLPEGGAETVHSVFAGPGGEIFLAAVSGKVWAVRDQEPAQLVADLEHAGRCYAAAMDRQGLMWIATDERGLVRLDPDSGEIVSLQSELPATRFLALAVDGRGAVWAGSDGGGLVRLAEDAMTRWTEADGLPGDTVRAVYVDPKGGVWIGADGGAAHIENNEVRVVDRSNGLPAADVYSLLRDREGALWFGTYGGGAARLTTEMFTHLDESSGLTGGLVYAMAEGPDGSMLFGTGGGGAFSLAQGQGRVEPLKGPGNVPGDVIYSIAVDDQDRIWFASYGQGVSVLDHGAWTTYTTAQGLPSDKVFYVMQDSRGAMWFATNQGVARLENGEFTVLDEDDGLADNEVLSIKEDSRGRIWLSTYGSGVMCLINNRVSTYTTANGLAGNTVYSIYEDADGALWFGTRGGLSRFDEDRFTSFTPEDGLSNDRCYFVIQDERGFYWIGTNKGLNRFDGRTFRLYDTTGGLMSNEFNDGAAFLDSRGRLWFGHVRGATRLDPDLDDPVTARPEIFLAALEAGGDTLDPETAPNEHPVLSHDAGRIALSFVAPYFTSPKDLVYRYRLDGLDTEWRNTTQRRVEFASLPPGDYAFWVSVSTRDNVSSDNKELFAFSVRRAFWNTWWCRVLAAAALVGLATLGYVLRVRHINQRNRELEETVRARTEDLRQERDKGEALLRNILPAPIVAEMQASGGAKPRRFDSATILFTDFKGFTSTASTLPPEHLVRELNDMFSLFDVIIAQHGLEKIKTIGDAYMIAGGLPEEREGHALSCVKAAMAMQDAMRRRNENSIIKWGMRAGLHSGAVVAGVVGTTKFTYDVWGDTVNIASRMESASEPGRVNISAFTYHLVRNAVEAEYRGKIEVKGKGEIDMYFVTKVLDG